LASSLLTSIVPSLIPLDGRLDLLDAGEELVVLVVVGKVGRRRLRDVT